MLSKYDLDSKSLIQGFIDEHVTGQGLDFRTEKAYRLDLEHFCQWAEQRQLRDSLGKEDSKTIICPKERSDVDQLEEWMETYLDYLMTEKKLSFSTVRRKTRVFGYFLTYLAGHRIIMYQRPLKTANDPGRKAADREYLSKNDLDAFFAAIKKEYEGLESEFRRRICLRDMVMMELLFCHKIEISELLRIETDDYNPQKETLTVRKKRGTDGQLYLYSQELRRNLKQWIEERKQFRAAGEYYNRMFLSKFGKPLSMKMVIKIFDKYRELAGIRPEFTPKDLKESCLNQYAKDLVMERWRE